MSLQDLYEKALISSCTFEEAKKLADKLDHESRQASAVLQKFPKLANGLTPDHVKATPEYKIARLASDRAFARLRDFNGFYTKKFAKEIREDRRRRGRSL